MVPRPCGYMEIKFRNVVSFRSEDIKFPAANLLRGGKWLNEKKSRSSVNDVTLRFGGAYSISHIDAGNWGSSFITIEVSHDGQQGFQTLLPSTELMSGRDAQAKKNWASVHMFSKENFVEDVLEQKWNVVRVTCLQPFLQNEQFGLSFLKIFSIPEDELHIQPAPQLPPPGSVFQMMRDCTTGRASPLVANRSQQLVLAAIEKQKTSTKCSNMKEATVTSSNVRESSCDKIDLFLSKTNERTNTLSGLEKKSPYNNKNFQNNASKSQSSPPTTHQSFSPSSGGSNRSIASRVGRQSHQAKQSSSVIVSNQKRTPPSDAADISVGTLRKKRRTLLLSPTGIVNNVKSPVPKAASLRKQWASGKELKLLQRQGNSSHDGHEDKEISDVTVISDSDSENSIVVSPLTSVLTNQELIDVDSDAETTIDLSSDQPHNEMYASKEVVTLTSPEHSSTSILSLKTEAVPGPSRIACPLCSEYFDGYLIEQHAATCGLSSGTEDSICPICSRFFSPEILPQHADLCAERSKT